VAVRTALVLTDASSMYDVKIVHESGKIPVAMWASAGGSVGAMFLHVVRSR
jgi:hypothetical protein